MAVKKKTKRAKKKRPSSKKRDRIALSDDGLVLQANKAPSGRSKWPKNVPEPCPRCFALAFSGEIRVETVMPLPESAPPLAIEDLGEHSPPGSPICHDCHAAENLAKCGILAAWVSVEPGGVKRPMPEGLDFAARRVATGNERQEQLRLPESVRPFFGLVSAGYMKPSVGEDALDRHHAWLRSIRIQSELVNEPIRRGHDFLGSQDT